MSDLLINIAGWFPAVILPSAAIFQLVKIIRTKDISGISIISWLLFGIANIGLYCFTEKFFELQTLIGLLGTAVLNFDYMGDRLLNR